MPVKLEWHASLPVLVLTYTGTLSRNDYTAMYDKRHTMLNTAERCVTLLADVRHLEGFTHPDAAGLRPNVLLHPSVKNLLVVLSEDVYRNLTYSIITHAVRELRVRFFADLRTALEFAQTEANG